MSDPFRPGPRTTGRTGSVTASSGPTSVERSEPIMARSWNRNPDSGVGARIAAVWQSASPDLRRRLVSIYALLIGFNVVVWAVLLLSSSRYGLLLGLAPVAFGFGLRHAVDPDHIAA